jgi:molybdopterin-guanine dinucleotide biosynthesis protein A
MTKYKNAVIFAGGKSSRMGEDKALLPFKKFNTLTEYQYHKLSKLFDKVSISSKENKFDFKANLIFDTLNISSPLVGIISIFETLDVEEVFILSVDTPFVDASIIDTLFIQAEHNNADAIVAQTADGVQPLCGIYRKSILTPAKKQLDLNNHKLQYLLKSIHTTYVSFKETTLFLNLNYPDEYQEAIQRL